MITIERPGLNPLEIEFVLIDFEGTLAIDRRVHSKAKDKINLLSKRTTIYILTKEKKELIEERLRKVKAEIIYLAEGGSSQRKLDLIHRLGPTQSVAIGNGEDDVAMIKEASIGISILGKEGSSGEALKNADLVFTDILDALDFLLKPLRQKTTLSK